jgi:beta-glucanase (GH16 family)
MLLNHEKKELMKKNFLITKINLKTKNMKQIAILITFILVHISVSAQTYVDLNTINEVPLIAIGQEYELDFSDEFDGTVLNINKWTKQDITKSRAPRIPISVDEWYWKKENVWLANGELVLHASKPAEGIMHCGSINANDKYERQYGYYETRIKIGAADKGSHAAFWFQGDNMYNVDSTANDGAEIDVLESAWLGDYTKATIHIDGYATDHQNLTKKYDTPGLHDGNYHTYALWWTKDFLKIYYDGVLSVTYDDPKWLVHVPEYLWLSNGASFGISGDQYFKNLPLGTLSHSYVDYVRVWRKKPATNAVVDLEAENAVISGNVSIEACSNASNQQMVNIKKTGVLSFQNIDVDYAGEYLLGISYVAGNNRQADIVVNGTTLPRATFLTSGSWCWQGGTTKTLYIPVELNALNNTIEVRAMGVNGPHIDKISLEMQVIVMEAENAKVSGDALYELGCGTTASAGELINIKKWGLISFRNIDVPYAGPYFLNVTYLNAGNRQANIIVNGVAIPTTTFPSSGGWCWQGGTTNTIEIPITLNRNDNVIQIQGTGVNGPHFDRIDLSMESILTTPAAKQNSKKTIIVFEKDNELIVESHDIDPIKNIEIFDLHGRLINKFQVSDSDNIEIPMNEVMSGVYIIRLFHESGDVVTEQIFIN